MKFYDGKIQNHLSKGGKIRNNIVEGSYIIYIDDNAIIRKDNGEHYTIKGQDLSSDKWEFVKSKYNWNKIIEDKILCVFSDNKNFQNGVISVLKNKDKDNYYNVRGVFYNYCKPFNPADFNIAKDLKDYEE